MGALPRVSARASVAAWTSWVFVRQRAVSAIGAIPSHVDWLAFRCATRGVLMIEIER